MQKNFDIWNEKKKKIHGENERLFFHVREIWFCSFGTNVGFEQDGKGEDFLRSVLVIRKFNNETFWGVPLTKTEKKISATAEKYYFSFSFLDGVQSRATLSQIRMIDSKRLARHIGVMNEDEFCQLTKKLKELIP